MSYIEDLLKEARSIAFEKGVPELSRQTGIQEDTLRRLLKDPPTPVKNLIKLEGLVANKVAGS